MGTAQFIPLGEIDYIDVHATLDYYLIVLKDSKGTWYARSYTADPKGLHGEFHDDRF